MGDPIPVLLYHSVPRAAQGDALSVPHELFRAHVQAICASGHTALSIGELAGGLRGVTPLPERAVAITFDDGYANNLAAAELLGESGLRATVYVTAGAVGSPGMLQREQVASLANYEHIEVGAHSVTHPHLDELDASQVEAELSGSKRYLEALIDRPVESFAYPYGAYHRNVREAVAMAGFSSAAAVKNALSHRADDPYAIARWTVGADTTLEMLSLLLDGRGAPIAWRSERLRTRGYRTVRKLRRRLGERPKPC